MRRVEVTTKIKFRLQKTVLSRYGLGDRATQDGAEAHGLLFVDESPAEQENQNEKSNYG